MPLFSPTPLTCWREYLSYGSIWRDRRYRRSFSSFFGDWCNETVATARHGFNKARVLGIVGKDSPQTLQNDVKAALEVDEGSVGPEPLSEFIAGNNFSRPFQKDRQDAEGLFLNF